MALSRENCRGVWVPLVTPFRDEQPDLEVLARVVDWLLERGVDGFLVLGSTGEAPHLTGAEALQVVRCVVESNRGRVPVMVGAGRPSVHDTLGAIDRFADAGADAALVITPSYYRSRMQPDVLRGYFEDVASRSRLPVFVYYIPQVTAIELDAAWFEAVLRHENVWGFKDSTVTAGPLAETLRRTSAQAFVGAGARVLDALEAGAHAGILAVAHVLPEVCSRLFSAWKEGRREVAEQMQAHAGALAAAFEGWTVPAVKWGLEHRGLPVGEPRSPLPAAPRVVRERVRRVIDAALQ